MGCFKRSGPRFLGRSRFKSSPGLVTLVTLLTLFRQPARGPGFASSSLLISDLSLGALRGILILLFPQIDRQTRQTYFHF